MIFPRLAGPVNDLARVPKGAELELYELGGPAGFPRAGHVIDGDLHVIHIENRRFKMKLNVSEVK